MNATGMGRVRAALVAAPLALAVGLGWFVVSSRPAEAGEPRPGSCHPAAEAADAAVVGAWLDALTEGGDVSVAIKRYWSPESTLNVPASLPYGGTYSRDEQLNYGSAVNQAWDTSELDKPAVHASCGAVYADARWTATARATGVRVDQALTEKFTVSKGRITSDTLFFYDTAELVRALGE